MKKIILRATIVCALIAAFASCKKTTNTSTEDQIAGKWIIKTAIGNYNVQGNIRKDTTKYTAADYFNFKTDGTVTIVETGVTYNGNWKITNDKLFFTNTNYIDYSGGFDIPVITGNDLQFHYKEVNPTNTLEQWLNLSK